MHTTIYTRVCGWCKFA